MDNKKLQDHKEKLEKERAELLAEIKSHEGPVDLGTDTEDREEETDKDEALENEFAIARDLKGRLDEVDIALGKISDGKYGVCEKCGAAIAPEVIDNDPATRFCKDCRPQS